MKVDRLGVYGRISGVHVTLFFLYVTLAQGERAIVQMCISNTDL